MEKESRREKFLFWLIPHSKNPWLWLPVIIASSILTNTGLSALIGLGVVIFGVLAFALGVNLALEATLGEDYAEKGLWKKKTREES